MKSRAWMMIVCGCLGSPGCGLERTWAAFQAASESDGDSPGESTAGSSGTSGGSSGSAGDSTDEGLDSSGAAEGTGGETSSSIDTASGSSSSSSGTSGPPAVCGDGVVEGDEECDDPGDTACYQCVRDRLVFVTSETYIYGDYAKVTKNIDYWCDYSAAVAGLLDDNKPRFKAWVSTSTASAAERLHHSRGRYVLRNGLVFAMSWDALVAGEILNPLNVDENSQTQNNGAWTDTRPDGSAMPGSHCDDWTSASDEFKAYWGTPPALDGNWTLYVGEATNPVACQNGQAMYCFESP